MGQDPCCADVHKWVLPHQSSVLINSRYIVDNSQTMMIWNGRLLRIQDDVDEITWLKTTTADKSTREMKWKWLIPSVDVNTSAELLTTAAVGPFPKTEAELLIILCCNIVSSLLYVTKVKCDN